MTDLTKLEKITIRWIALSGLRMSYDHALRQRNVTLKERRDVMCVDMIKKMSNHVKCQIHILIYLGSLKIAHYLQNRRKPPRKIRCT
jgi:hypothetical protein